MVSHSGDKIVNEIVFNKSIYKYVLTDSPLERKPSVGYSCLGGCSHTDVLMGSMNELNSGLLITRQTPKREQEIVR